MTKQTLLICIDGLAGQYLKDPNVKAPHLQKLMNEGGVVSRLKTTYPSVTWVANTSAVTGCFPNKHGVLGNSIFDHTTKRIAHHWGDQLGSKEDFINVPTLYDLFAEKGMKTASVCWPVTREAKNIAYNIPEFYDQDLFESYSTLSYWDELKAFFPIENYAEWSSQFSQNHKQDRLTKDILQYTLENKDASFIMGHFLSIDSMLHDYGNASPEVYEAIEHTDQLVGELITYIDLNKPDMDVVLYSDHGHMDVHTAFYPNRLLEEYRLDEHYIAVSNDGCFYLYRLDQTEHENEEVQSLFRSLPYVKEVFTQSMLSTSGLPFEQREKHEHMPDLIVELKEGYLSKDDVDVADTLQSSTYRSTHGYSPDLPSLKGFMIGYGPSFQKGITIQDAHIIDIAPTIAKMRDLPYESMDGQPIQTLVKEGGKQVEEPAI